VKGGENMTAILNMIPIEQKQNTPLQNTNNKEGTKNRKSEAGFAKALNIETEKSGTDVDSKLKNGDNSQLMPMLAGVVIPLIVNVVSAEQVNGSGADALGETVSLTQPQLASAVSIVPQVQLTNVVPVVPETQLTNAVPIAPEAQSTNVVPVVPQTQSTNVVPVVPQTQLTNVVPVVPQKTTVQQQEDNTQLGSFLELQTQTQLQIQKKAIDGQVEKTELSITNPEQLLKDLGLSKVKPSVMPSGNTSILGKNSSKQAENTKIALSQVNVQATEGANNVELVENVEVKPVLASQMAVTVGDNLHTEFKENADASLPTPTIKNPDNFASVLNQQGIKMDSLTSVDVKPEALLPVVDSHNITGQIVDQARLVSGLKNTEMIIKLKPEHLGELTFKVTVENGIVSASFHSNNSEVRNMIESSLYQLKQELSNQGLKIDNVGVYAGLGEFFSNDQQSGGYQQPVIRTQHKKSEEDFLDVFEATDSADKVLDASGVDYRV